MRTNESKVVKLPGAGQVWEGGEVSQGRFGRVGRCPREAGAPFPGESGVASSKPSSLFLSGSPGAEVGFSPHATPRVFILSVSISLYLWL